MSTAAQALRERVAAQKKKEAYNQAIVIAERMKKDFVLERVVSHTSALVVAALHAEGFRTFPLEKTCECVAPDCACNAHSLVLSAKHAGGNGAGLANGVARAVHKQMKIESSVGADEIIGIMNRRLCLEVELPYLLNADTKYDLTAEGFNYSVLTIMPTLCKHGFLDNCFCGPKVFTKVSAISDEESE